MIRDWEVLREGAIVRITFEAPCGHRVMIHPEWLTSDGRFSGRLGCTTPDCRKIHEDVVLEGYSAEEVQKRG